MLTPEQQAAVERLELTARDRLFGFQPTGMRDDILLLISALRTCLKDSERIDWLDKSQFCVPLKVNMQVGNDIRVAIDAAISHPQPRKEM